MKYSLSLPLNDFQFFFSLSKCGEMFKLQNQYKYRIEQQFKCAGMGMEKIVQTYKIYNAATKRVYQTSQKIVQDQISLDHRKLTPNHLKR